MPPRLQENVAVFADPPGPTAMEADGSKPKAGSEARAGLSEQESAVAKRKKDRQSLDYIIKSGIAGGLAGCAVGVSSTTPPKASSANIALRQKQSSALSTASRSSSKPRPPNSPNTAAHGSALSPPCEKSIRKTACAVSSADTLRRSSASSPTPA